MKNKIIITVTILFSLFFIVFIVRTTNELSSAQYNILKSKNVIEATDLVTTRLLITEKKLEDNNFWATVGFEDEDWSKVKIPSYQVVKHPRFKPGNYAYYRIKIPREAFYKLNHLKNETSIYLQSIFFNKFDIYINGEFFRTYKPEKPSEYKIIVPVDELKDNIVAIIADIKDGDTGIDSRNQIMLGKGLEFNEVLPASYKAQTVFQLVFILCKGSILFIFSLIFLLLKVNQSFEKFFVFGICVLIEELIAGDYLYGPLNFNQMVYLYNAVNVGAAISLFLFFGDLLNRKLVKQIVVFYSIVLTFITFCLAVDSLHFNYLVDLSAFMKVWNLIFVLIQLYYLPKIIKMDKVLSLGLMITVSLSLWSALFSTNIGLNFKAYGNLLLFFIVAYQTFALFRREQEELKLKDMLLFEQEKDVAIGKTATLFAHDVRKPLEQLKLIMERISTGNFDKNFIDTAKNEIDISISSVDQQVNDIMNYSKVVSINLAEISFYRVLNHALKQVMSLHQEMNLNLTYELEANVRILGEESRLSGILVNLLANGVEAIRDLGGRFEGNIKISTALENDYFVFKIFNDGPEIPVSNLTNIFKPLFTQGKANGTGLGLASVVKSVNLHNGSIQVENVTNQGVQFTLRFLKGEQVDKTQNYNFKVNSKLYRYDEIPRSIELNQGTIKILFLESDSSRKDQLNAVLGTLSLKTSIYAVSSELEAEELVRKYRFDLYLMNSLNGGDNIYDKLLSYLTFEVVLYKGNLPISLKNDCQNALWKRKRILYVDDTRIFRVAWQMFHGDSNITCLSSPEEALAFVSENPVNFDIFVFDYHFSNSSLDGVALGKKIKEFNPYANILISSSVEQSNSEFRSINKSDFDVRKYFNG